MPRSFLAKVVLCCLAFTLLFASAPTAAPAQINVSVSFGPPAIPYYVQPQNPTPNYIWAPGYWAYDSYGGGYYWVPGTWVQAPQYGLLWTPGFWAWNGSRYFWTPGYWSQNVGYYGGVNYGYGYYGRGYVGGRWHGRQFQYNTAVSHVDRNVVHDVYVDRTVVVNDWNRVSYNGGRGGIVARPNTQELAVQRAHHVNATPVQVQHQHFASQNRAAFSRANQGRPAITAVPHPLTAAPRAPERRATQPQHRALPVEGHPVQSRPVHAPAAVHAAPVHPAPQQPPTAHTAPHQTSPERQSPPTAHDNREPH